ncbi:MAG: hypothetical protein K6G51_04005 [Sphaerochaetaceae bacterium]|nr:hypothetical protein [Sphaerochaetaceae bacterium]
MIQLYVITLIYLFLAASTALYDTYRGLFSFVFSYRHRLHSNRRFRHFIIISGPVLALLNLFFPQDPGPRYLGNLVPAFACLYSAYFYIRYIKGGAAEDILNPSPFKGYMLFLVTILHFLFPFLVLL